MTAHDRRIRKARKSAIRAEREKCIAEYREKKRRREAARKGGPVVVRQDPDPEPCYRALRTYHPLMFCEVCRQIKREDWMHSETVCLGCHYDESSCESVDPTKENESQGKNSSQEHVSAASKGAGASAPVPGEAAGQGTKEKAQPRGQVGQDQLIFEF